MKKWMKNLLILAVIGAVVGAGVVYYVFNKPHRDIAGEEAAFKMNATELYGAFSEDEDGSTLKFADQVIEVSGTIAELTVDGYEVSIVLNDEMEGVNCALDSMTIDPNKAMIEALKLGDEITLKGKCDGFDMIMGVVLTRCFVVQ